MHLVCYHKRRIESQAEMTNHIVFRSLVFVFLKKFCCAGKCNLGNVLFHFLGSHSQTVVREFQGLLFRVHLYLDGRLVVVRQLVFSHHIQFL